MHHVTPHPTPLIMAGPKMHKKAKAKKGVSPVIMTGPKMYKKAKAKKGVSRKPARATDPSKLPKAGRSGKRTPQQQAYRVHQTNANFWENLAKERAAQLGVVESALAHEQAMRSQFIAEHLRQLGLSEKRCLEAASLGAQYMEPLSLPRTQE